jgi:hypothetical protein
MGGACGMPNLATTNPVLQISTKTTGIQGSHQGCKPGSGRPTAPWVSCGTQRAFARISGKALRR